LRRSEHDVLFEPLQIGSKTFRNRFYSVPHALFKPGRRLSEIGFRRMKAEGGWAAVCGGIISIRPDNWGGNAPRIWDETDRGVLGRVAQEVKGQGALAGIELGHSGALSEGEKFTPAMGISQVGMPEHAHVVPHAMDTDEIRSVQDSWVDAGRTAADLGYDIVYAYGAHGFLPAQFMSPFFNTRTDAYGGSLENRARFWLEVLERLRDAVLGRCLVAARIAAENFSPYGASAEDMLGFVRLADDLVDVWDVNVGFHWPPDSAPSRLAPEGSQLEWSGRIREATAKPIVGVGRLTNPDRMAEIIRSGVWDFIGGARPGIADPFLPRKIEEGRYGEIRECTGANFCIAVETGTAGLSCLQNPTVGEEYRRGWHPERYGAARDESLDVLVVGAGPAGMECARVLGERGFRRVHLVDAADDVGGHLNWLTRLPGLGEWARITNYRKIQLERLKNVELIMRTNLGADDVIEYGAELVVLATGARWIDENAAWHHLPTLQILDAGIEVLTPEQIMLGQRMPSSRAVVVWDGDGSSVAVGLAEKLAAEGFEVSLATSFGSVAPLLDLSFEGAGVRRRLHELGVSMHAAVMLRGVEGEAVVLADEYAADVRVEAGTLVLVAQRVSNDGLYNSLREQDDRVRDAGVLDVFRIGDCQAPRALGYAILDGHRLGREIDAEAPHVPRAPCVEQDAAFATARFDFEDHAGPA
jgi:dimethylamine/trimethylamine dehydrogenase